MLIALRRQDAQIAQTEALVHAVVGAASGSVEGVNKALTEYRNTVLPFMKGTKERDEAKVKKALKDWTENTAFKVRPLWMATQKRKQFSSKMRKRVDQVKAAESERGKKWRRRQNVAG